MANFSLYGHKGGLKPHSFISCSFEQGTPHIYYVVVVSVPCLPEDRNTGFHNVIDSKATCIDQEFCETQ